MKPVSNLMSLVGSEPNYQAPAEKEIPETVAKFVDRLFERLKAIFPAWKSAFAEEKDYHEAKRVWTQALFNNGISTAAQFKTGLQQAEKSASPFFPSVGQFIEWCKSGNEHAALGLPTADELLQSYYKFRSSAVDTPEEYPWQSAVEYHLVLQLKQAIYQGNLSEKETVTRAKTLIAKMAKYLKSGGEVAEPEAPKLPAEKTGRQLSPEEICSRIAGLRAMMGKTRLSGASAVSQ